MKGQNTFAIDRYILTPHCVYFKHKQIKVSALHNHFSFWKDCFSTHFFWVSFKVHSWVRPFTSHCFSGYRNGVRGPWLEVLDLEAGFICLGFMECWSKRKGVIVKLFIIDYCVGYTSEKLLLWHFIWGFHSK